MKIQFNHKADNLSDSLNLPKERIKEIKNVLYNKATGNNSSFISKSDLIEQVMNELNITKPAELFVLGTVFGVMDYLQHEKDNLKEMKEQATKAIANIDKGVSPILDLDKFKKEMKDGEQDF